MAHTVPHRGVSRTDHGAAPVLIFLISALAIVLGALAFLVWSGQTRLSNQRVDLSLPKGAPMPRPSSMPNPQPLPAPVSRPG